MFLSLWYYPDLADYQAPSRADSEGHYRPKVTVIGVTPFFSGHFGHSNRVQPSSICDSLKSKPGKGCIRFVQRIQRDAHVLRCACACQPKLYWRGTSLCSWQVMCFFLQLERSDTENDESKLVMQSIFFPTIINDCRKCVALVVQIDLRVMMT